MKSSLIQKYNVPGPRYTSYPTVPYWDATTFSPEAWAENVVRSFNESNESEGISIYIHLPYCESLCTFCGCHKHITKNHAVEEPYITALLKEWKAYCALFPTRPRIKELHLGGGTPTFFSPAELTRLINGIFEHSEQLADAEMSFEGHPNNTTKEHLQTLYNLGFRRVSFGVQDYNPEVQKAINRVQPFHNVAKATLWAREIGYTSVGHDIIFGLPFQTLEHVLDTIEKTKSLAPDRLAFYSYAHVPWIKGNGQRGFKDSDIPKDDVKRQLYEEGKKRLIENGYTEIGMDHFALPHDSLHQAMETGKLHRNFMGYTASKTQLMVGLGASSISDSWYAFAQNEKTVADYLTAVDQGKLPVFKGHVLTHEDLVVRTHILNLMCRFETNWKQPELFLPQIPSILQGLKPLKSDGLLDMYFNKLAVSEQGKAFVRNICMAFDLRLQRQQPERTLFSMTI